MLEAKLGSLQIIDVRVLYRRFFGICIAVFLLGNFLGGYVSHVVYANEQSGIPQALIVLGEHICKQWDGLAEIGRVRPAHYAFRCRSLAVFPDVEVTLAKNKS